MNPSALGQVLRSSVPCPILFAKRLGSPWAIAFEALKGTGFSPYIAAMPKNGLQPPRDTAEEVRLASSVPQGLKPRRFWLHMYGLKPVPFQPFRTLPTFSLFSKNDPNAIALGKPLPPLTGPILLQIRSSIRRGPSCSLWRPLEMSIRLRSTESRLRYNPHETRKGFPCDAILQF